MDRFALRLVATLGPLLVWAVHFGALYLFFALAYARGVADRQVAGIGIVPLVVALATILALAAVFGCVWHALRAGGGDAAGLLRYLVMASAALAAIGIAWNALPAFVLA